MTQTLLKLLGVIMIISGFLLPTPDTNETPVQQAYHDETITELVMNISKHYQQDPATVLQIVEATSNAAEVFNLPRELILGVIATESSFDPFAKSNKGAKGLMQIHPTSGLTPTYDIHENVMSATGFLKVLVERKGVEGALSYYNAGHKGSRKYPKKVLAKVEQFI